MVEKNFLPDRISTLYILIIIIKCSIRKDKKAETTSNEKFRNSVGLVETKTITIVEANESFELDSGKKLSPVEVAYETYGTLNAEGSNAVYFCHALTGNAHIAGYNNPEDEKPGWWEDMVGPGKYIDTNKYFVICSNFLGGCSGTTGPASINPATGKPYGLSFPLFTIKDMAKAHRMFIEKLGIKKLLAIIGGSMGGMHAMRLAIDYPDLADSVVLIATTSRLSAQAIAFDAVGRNAILADKQFKDGMYCKGDGPDKGLGIARMIGHITYLSEEGMRQKFGRSLRNSDSYNYDFDPEFSVETYLDHQGRRFVERFDANCYLYITRAMDYFDLSMEFGSLKDAFSHSKARFLIVSYSSDWLFPARQSKEIVDALIELNRDVTYCNIESQHGHDAFLIETDVIGPMMRDFIDASKAAPMKSNAEFNVLAGRTDYDIIQNRFIKGGKVLDLGCGEGELLERLKMCCGCEVTGIDYDITSIGKCIKKGLPAIWGDIEKNLESFSDGHFDYVVLSRTLQAVKKPKDILGEIVRVGKKAIVTFPNFANLRCRMQMLTSGRAPITKELPYNWYDSPNIHFLSIRDFELLCKTMNIRIEQKFIPNSSGTEELKFLPNLFGAEAIYLLSRNG